MESTPAILNELKELSPTVAGLGQSTPYQVPPGYFEGLAAQILSRIKTQDLSAKEEIETLSPLLSGLSKKTPYEVPAGYFTNVTANVLNNVKPQAKVVRMNPARRVIRYAAAAVVAAVMAVAGWFYFDNKGVTAEETLAQVSDTELVDYLENETQTASAVAVTMPENTDMDEADVRELLSGISDEELHAYITTL
ncbi:MAG TPA: hypothetical protein VD996_05380 [Chitinophagaceae bacterium]|nr:hypothetical protein [Chitinophagaceae bacterium]